MPKKLALVPMKARIADIQSVYAGAAERIIGVLSGLDPATFTTADHGAALKRVREIVLLLNDQVRMWAPSAIKAAYDESADIARTRLELIGAKKSKRYNPARHDRKIGMLARTVERDFFKANLTIEKTAKKFLGVMAQAAAGVKKIEQVQMFEAADSVSWIKRIIKKAREGSWGELAAAGATVGAVAKGVGASLSRGQVSKQILEYLKKKIGGGDFININGRNYNLKDYAELVARTRMRESQSEATKELCAEFNNDLVQFSKHDSPCEVCAPLEGQVFSISGDDPDYPELTDDETPPIHPRCEHDIGPTSKNALAWRNA